MKKLMLFLGLFLALFSTSGQSIRDYSTKDLTEDFNVWMRPFKTERKVPQVPGQTVTPKQFLGNIHVDTFALAVVKRVFALGVQTSINANTTTANSALSIANTASANASTAITTANTANATASTANTNANTALTTANSANTNASAAVTTANTANTNASAAVTTANTASASVSSALTNKLSFLVSTTFSSIPVQSGANYKLILVLTDETNNNYPTLYVYDGVGLQWLPTQKIY